MYSYLFMYLCRYVPVVMLYVYIERGRGLSMYRSVHLPIWPPSQQSIRFSYFLYPSIYLFIYLSICQSIYLSISISSYLSIYRYTYIYIYVDTYSQLYQHAPRTRRTLLALPTLALAGYWADEGGVLIACHSQL